MQTFRYSLSVLPLFTALAFVACSGDESDDEFSPSKGTSRKSPTSCEDTCDVTRDMCTSEGYVLDYPACIAACSKIRQAPASLATSVEADIIACTNSGGCKATLSCFQQVTLAALEKVVSELEKEANLPPPGTSRATSCDGACQIFADTCPKEGVDVGGACRKMCRDVERLSIGAEFHQSVIACTGHTTCDNMAACIAVAAGKFAGKALDGLR